MWRQGTTRQQLDTSYVSPVIEPQLFVSDEGLQGERFGSLPLQLPAQDLSEQGGYRQKQNPHQ